MTPNWSSLAHENNLVVSGDVCRHQAQTKASAQLALLSCFGTLLPQQAMLFSSTQSDVGSALSQRLTQVRFQAYYQAKFHRHWGPF